MTALDRALMSAAPGDLLPSRRSDEAARMERPLTVVAEVDLGESAVSGSRAYLVVLADGRGVRYGVPCVLDGGRLRRARPGDGVSAALVALLAGSGAQPVDGLRVESFATPDIEASELPMSDLAMSERGIDVDQTNELVIVGERTIVKWILHPSDADEPAPRRLGILARARFGGTPRLIGFARLHLATSHALVAMVSEYVPGSRDGWEWAVDDVRTWAVGGRGLTRALDPVRDVGRLVADLHVALATGGEFVATPADASRWAEQAAADADDAGLDPAVDARVRPRLQPIADAAGSRAIYAHGDLHIGQILRSQDGRCCVVDFDGSPMLDAAERMRPVPAARDAASMLASLDHVGRVVVHRTDDLDDEAVARVLVWIERAQEVFLEAYRSALRAAGRADLLDEALLTPFQVQQECREYAYARRYLPHWRYVPDAALPALLSRGPR